MKGLGKAEKAGVEEELRRASATAISAQMEVCNATLRGYFGEGAPQTPGRENRSCTVISCKKSQDSRIPRNVSKIGSKNDEFDSV